MAESFYDTFDEYEELNVGKKKEKKKKKKGDKDKKKNSDDSRIKIKVKHKEQSRDYNEDMMDECAKCLNTFMDYFTFMIIKDDMNVKEIEKAKETVEKLIANLEAHNGDQVFNQEVYDDMQSNMR